jgi:cyclin-dependent kinase regulatory subunit CKS1
MLKVIPKEYFDGARGTLKLLWEEEWRALGITQVRGVPNSLQLTCRRC